MPGAGEGGTLAAAAAKSAAAKAAQVMAVTVAKPGCIG